MQGWDALPDEIRRSIAELRARNPGWEYRFYDADAIEAFIGETYGQGMLDLYQRIDPAYYSPRSDLFRHLVCYAEGGAYFDIKSTALSPLDEVIRSDDVYLLSQWPELARIPPEGAGSHAAAHRDLVHVPGWEYTNWFIVTAPGHPFQRATIERTVENIRLYRPFVHGVGTYCALRLGGPITYTLAVHPLRAVAPHRMAHLYDELDFRFSIYGDPLQHREKLGTHYRRQVLPVIRQGPVTTAATKAWFGTLKPKLLGVRRRLGLS